MSTFSSSEQYLSQIPALQQLINMGYRYLAPDQVSAERGGNYANVLLEKILREQLEKNNRISFKGGEHRFSEENIQSAIRKLKNSTQGGLQKSSKRMHDLITLGTSLPQTIEGSSKSHTVNYIDWKDLSNNVFHVVAEFSVERSSSSKMVRPDIVLFVNGIPLVVIECKSPSDDVEQAVSQMIRNQGSQHAPRLFAYTQLLLAVNKNAAKYGTTGTDIGFWSVWNELEDAEDAVNPSVCTALSDSAKDALFSAESTPTRSHFDKLEGEGGRVITAQDKCLYSLCRPQRLLEIAYGFTLYDAGEKKIARYHQFFLVRSALDRIKQKDKNGRRMGGIVWHTQGSGKSITMVMLVRALALYSELTNPRIILVTDRKDLDNQLGNTFTACGLDKKQATSGSNLLEHLKGKVGIITTLVNKFEKALEIVGRYVDESPDIIVLVDESHRTHFGTLAAGMRRMLPKACYIGFTGTPLLKKDRNSFERFGGIIYPAYPVRQAILDKAVVPLLYEGRHVEIEQKQDVIDLWFARHTEDLNDNQRADLKRKFARASTLNQADRVIYMRAFDIGRHFKRNWNKTGFKAQLVSPSKASALKYHNYLKDIGAVSSAVVISPPDAREGYEEVDEDPNDEVIKFWKKVVKRHSSEEKYTKSIIHQFKHDDEPEILIVVDKLITGFDAPRNTVLYLCRKLRDHTLLQAIARVNRLCKGKEFGYIIDYNNVLRELKSALHTYDELSDFDEKDLKDFLTSIEEQVSKLPQSYSDLWDLFKEVRNSVDEERYELLLSDKEDRDEFYDRLYVYQKTLGIALSSEKFIMRVEEEELKLYKQDLKKFQKLKSSVKLRYSERIDYRDYEPRIKKMLDTEIQANQVTQLNEPMNIFDGKTFTQLKERKGVYSKMSKGASADAIAHATKRSINENLDKDPAFYEKFSKLIQDAIDAFRNQHISDLEYLKQVSTIRDEIVKGRRDDVPEKIRGNSRVCAYFGVIKPCLAEGYEGGDMEKIAAEIALEIERVIKENRRVDFWSDSKVQGELKNQIDDFLYDKVGKDYGVPLSVQQKDQIINKTLKVAEFWERP